MTAAEIRAMDDARIRQEIQNARQELFALRFRLAVGQATNTARFSQLRRDIARMETILRERQG